MNLSGKREFCLWVVGGKDGRVRKVRFSLKALLGATAVVSLVGAGFVFVASDYARAHLQRAESYFRMKRLQVEKQKLEDSKQTLESKVAHLETAQQRSLSYEQQVKARLDELASLLRASDPGGMLSPSLGAGSRGIAARGRGGLGKADPKLEGSEVGVGGETDSEASDSAVAKHEGSSPKGADALASATKEDGVGGAEIDCESDSGACGLEMSELSMAQDARAMLRPSSVRARQADQERVIAMLDSYLDVLRMAPIGLPAPGYINSGFGFRFSPFHGRLSMHEGIDFALPHGSRISSTGDGVVLEVERNSTYGLVVDIAHSDRVVTRYAHLSKAFVSKGEKVCRGEVLGLVGTSGRSTGPHLHYEVLVDGKARNPMPYVQLALDVRNLLESGALVPPLT